VLYATFARAVWAPDYDWTWKAEERDASSAQLVANWGKGLTAAGVAPSRAGDPKFMDWAARLERLAARPGPRFAKIISLIGEFDVRRVLPSIRVPTLVAHRRDDTFINFEHALYFAEQIPGARLLELEGSDSLFSIGDTEAFLGEVEEFLTGTRHEREPDRMLATVMFTDICKSTERAAELGDASWRAPARAPRRPGAAGARPPPRAGDQAHRRRLPGHLRRAGSGHPLRRLDRGGGAPARYRGALRAPQPASAR